MYRKRYFEHYKLPLRGPEHSGERNVHSQLCFRQLLPATRSVATEEELLATFGNVTIVDLVDLADTDFVYYSQNIIASSTITRLEFQDREDPGFRALDDIGVTLVTGTPELRTTLLSLIAALFSAAAVLFGRRHLRGLERDRA
jgi:hypothetical protein